MTSENCLNGGNVWSSEGSCVMTSFIKSQTKCSRDKMLWTSELIGKLSLAKLVKYESLCHTFPTELLDLH